MSILRYPTDWLARVDDALRMLAERPWLLLVTLLCVSAIAQPYAGITHDSRLYSVQVLNRVETGAYADDLFFRYGSQDDYSLFSHLAVPLVRWVGLPLAFFVIYLASKTLLIFGMIRIVQSLVPHRSAGVLALIYGMSINLYYGGLQVLSVQENFVTPRTPACALVLVGLDLLLRNRPVWSLALILLAAGLHPLMAFGGLLIWAGYHVWTYLGVTTFVGSLAGAIVLAGIVLGIEPIGTRCFGVMDDEWREAIIHASCFNFPSQWARGDWWYLVFQLAVLGIIIWRYQAIDPGKARFLIVLGIVTVAGTIGAVLAEQLPYALFLQGQPYRTLWILAFLNLAFVVQLCLEWSREGDDLPAKLRQLASCGLLAYLCCINGIVNEFLLPMLLFPIVVVALRGLHAQPEQPSWLVQGIQLSLVVGALGWAAYKTMLLARGWNDLYVIHLEYRDVLETFLRNLGPVVFTVAACAVLARVTRETEGRPARALAPIAACLGVQLLFFAFPETDFYLDHCTRYRGDLRKAHELVHGDRDPSRPLPTVYSNLGCLDYVWLDLHSKSYFDWWQAGNYMFRREMAMEGRRRARLVAPLALERYRQMEGHLSQGHKDGVARFYEINFDRDPVGKDDLARVCREPGLDFLVLDVHIEGVNAVPAGSLYVYSCQEVRAALNLTVDSSAVRTASRRP